LGAHDQDADLAKAGRAILAALDETVVDPATRTRDLGGTLGTNAFALAVADRVRNMPMPA
jgi:3-isopropylmalate dehydrogenase